LLVEKFTFNLSAMLQFMKGMRGVILILACSVCSALNAQVLPVGSSGTATSRPELDQLAGDYEAQEKSIDSEIEPQLKSARDRYAADLESLTNKHNQAKRPEEADKVRSEAKRFAERGLNGEPSKDVPAEVRTAWTTLLRSTIVASQSVALKRNTVRAKFTQALTALEQTYRAKSDAEGFALARRARSTVAIRSAIEANRIAATELAGKGGRPWQDVVKEGGYIVGFEAGKGGWFQFSVLGSLRPIFATARGTRDGERRGKTNGNRVVAKEGYAVGGLQVRAGEVVNCVQIIFMRINPDGISLNPQDFYVTDWLGGEGGGKPREISARGRMVVGVTGSTGDVVDSIGLIYLR
jgi:hypothetical protein